jgi:hypothetical protein
MGAQPIYSPVTGLLSVLRWIFGACIVLSIVLRLCIYLALPLLLLYRAFGWAIPLKRRRKMIVRNFTYLDF